MRATTLLNRVLNLPGVRVTGIDPDGLDGAGSVHVRVALTRRRLACPRCSFTTARRYDCRGMDSSWRHLDLGGRVCRLQLRRRRLACPQHGVITEGVPFARPGSRFTRVFEDLVAWLTTRSDKTTVSAFARVAWRTVGAAVVVVRGCCSTSPPTREARPTPISSAQAGHRRRPPVLDAPCLCRLRSAWLRTPTSTSRSARTTTDTSPPGRRRVLHAQRGTRSGVRRPDRQPGQARS